MKLFGRDLTIDEVMQLVETTSKSSEFGLCKDCLLTIAALELTAEVKRLRNEAQARKKKYKIIRTGEEVLLLPEQVWYTASYKKLEGLKDTTIYVDFMAMPHRKSEFDRFCWDNNIQVIVVSEVL